MPEVLVDRSASGRIRPWREHKLSNEKLSSIYHLLSRQESALKDHYSGRAERLENCGSSLIFAECPNGHGKRLKQAYFCKQRLCAVCSWRKTLFVYHQFLQVAHEVLKHHPDYQFVFITLSRKNCSGERLNDELTHLMRSFERLKRYKRFKVIKGTFRTNEITYNPLSNDYHPHIHAIGAVPSSYFKKNYISQSELIQLWRKAVQVNYDPTVDIRKVRKKRKGIDTVQESIVEMDQALHDDSLPGAAAEVAKYAVKVQDIIQPRPKRDDSEKMKQARLGLADNVIHQAKVVACLDAAMNRRRMISYSGVFKEAYQSTNQTDVEQSSLILMPGEEEKTACTCKICQSELVQVHYLWNRELRKHVKNRVVRS